MAPLGLRSRGLRGADGWHLPLASPARSCVSPAVRARCSRAPRAVRPTRAPRHPRAPLRPAPARRAPRPPLPPRGGTRASAPPASAPAFHARPCRPRPGRTRPRTRLLCTPILTQARKDLGRWRGPPRSLALPKSWGSCLALWVQWQLPPGAPQTLKVSVCPPHWRGCKGVKRGTLLTFPSHPPPRTSRLSGLPLGIPRGAGWRKSPGVQGEGDCLNPRGALRGRLLFSCQSHSPCSFDPAKRPQLGPSCREQLLEALEC